MELGWIGVIVAIIAATYSLTKYFIEDKRKFKKEKEWEEFPSGTPSPIAKQLQGFYLDIYNKCAAHIDCYENKHNIGVVCLYLPKIEAFLLKYNNRPDEGNADQVALTILWNFTSDALKCGTYHFHIGALTPEGNIVRAFAEYCLDLSVQRRYCSKDDADEALHALVVSIQSAG